ncbi:xanthine dehydrogenase family protein molybdopterin-binding subunit [Saccharobesus litoralis]|uniref:Xanthine dehydrogenase family protein molybdopterin-binding subunit n=1 Tax=Saccharobesus litoralis TaxID=2172099 RepID=A0A2S0VLQ0_9ALTE|nr:molybdopterin cofactor-binding domain-containing protein [Saccharobesus litoralis]AWB65137.1 xanthine dehydrogenase family protein molybdopterin-binding subunit [Saccharobesus litoralis]
MNTFKLDRREFLTLTGIAGSGLLLGCNDKATSGKQLFGQSSEPQKLNVFVSIRPDNTVDIINHRSEMGQGAKTGTIQMIADELDVDWEKINVIQGLGDKAYGSQNTDGSTSVRQFYSKLREVGASARTMLEQAAAEYWQVDKTKVQAKNHKVTNLTNGNTLNYGDLAELAAKQPVPDVASLTYKTPEQFKYITKPVPIVDLHDMTTGNTTFGIDFEMPGLLIASIERCPVLYGKVKSFDATAAKAVPGVVDVINMPDTVKPVVFNAGSGVAVIATNTWAANQGRKALKIEWDLGENKDFDTEVAFADMASKAQNPATRSAEKGDLAAGFAKATKTLEANYKVPFLAHAPMEPPAASAVVTDTSCEVWAATQNPQAVMSTVAGLVGLKPEQIKVHVTLLGGGFGRKSKADFAAEAVYLAKKTGKPIKVVWTREDDLRVGYFHAGAAAYIKAGVDDNANITAWQQRSVMPSIKTTFSHNTEDMLDVELTLGFNDIPFKLESLQSESSGYVNPVRIGWMRSVSNIPHAFALHSFVDELAHAQGIPTRQYLRQLYAEDRLVSPPNDYGFKNYKNYDESLERHPVNIARFKGVLDKLEALVDFDEKLPEGQAWGLAIHRSFVSYVGVASKVQVKNGKLTVLEMQSVIDCGVAVNPDRVTSQIEGAMIFGLSLALMGKIEVKEGAVVQSNFHDYPVLRMSQCPKLNVEIISSEHYPGGVGEPGVPPVAPSLANAIFAASGQRYRELPLNQYLQV